MHLQITLHHVHDTPHYRPLRYRAHYCMSQLTESSAVGSRTVQTRVGYGEQREGFFCLVVTGFLSFIGAHSARTGNVSAIFGCSRASQSWKFAYGERRHWAN